MSRRHPVALLLRAVGGLLLVLASVPLATAALAGDTSTVSAKALSDLGCDDTQWHFVITGLDGADQAPDSIAVSWSDGGSAAVALSRVTGGVGHYSTTAHLDATVTSATATIAADWKGQFNLSAGPCGETGGGGGGSGGGSGSTSVTAGTPTVDESCAKDAAIVTIPSTEHVAYTLNGQAVAAGEHQVAGDSTGHYTVVVNATAKAGFTLTGATHWDLSGTLSCGTAGEGDTTTVSAKALTDHGCDNSEWHFVITGLDSDAQAPDHITVTWDGGATAEVALGVVTGHTAHYRTTAHLDLAVTSATAAIDSGWGGQFNLSHGPCMTGGGTESVTAGTPTVVKSCEEHAAIVTIPSTEHVAYTLNGQAVAAGQHQVAADSTGHYTVVVNATAKAGFTLTGTTHWDLSGTLSCGTSGGGTTPVAVVAPTVAESCTLMAAVVTIPDTAHVTYSLNGQLVAAGPHAVAADSAGHYTVVVTASAASGYTLTGQSVFPVTGTLVCATTGGSGTTPASPGTGAAAGGIGSGTPGATAESTPATAVLGTQLGSGTGTSSGVLSHTGPVMALGSLVATGGGLVLLGVLLMGRHPQHVRVLAPARGRHRAQRRG